MPTTRCRESLEIPERRSAGAYHRRKALLEWGVAGGARPVWLGDDRRASFSWWHEPRDGRCRAGVVLCPPVGFDYLRSHDALRRLGEELTHVGLCVVRLDYDGTGDSTGDDRDPDRVAAWLGTVRSAAALLRLRGAPAVCVIGMRLGATLGAHAAAADGAVDQVVLWDPCVSGKSFLNEQRALGALALGIAPFREDGSLETPGAVYDAATAHDLEQLSILSCPRPLARRVLVLTRPDRPSNPGMTQASLAREELRFEEASGQHELMDLAAPELPIVAIRRVVAWLSDGAPASPVPVRTPPAAGARVVGLDTHGRPIYERPVRVPPVGLFGIMTHTEDVDRSTSTPTPLLFNSGITHRVGPSRLWVDLARRWAEVGLRSIRLDLSGIGDSPSRDPADTVWTCIKPDAFADVTEAMHWASPADPTNVVLVGLCSSGYQALEGALQHGARGVVAINPSISFVPPERRAGRPLYPGRRIALPQDAIADTFREGGRLGWLRHVAPGLAWRARTLRSPGHRAGSWLTDLVRHGTDTLLVCGDDELRPIRHGITGVQLRHLTRGGLLRLEHVRGMDHSLLLADQLALVGDLVADHVIARFAPHVGGPAPLVSRVTASS